MGRGFVRRRAVGLLSVAAADALVALRSGWVIVGSLPTADGTSATVQPGEL